MRVGANVLVLDEQVFLFFLLLTTLMPYQLWFHRRKLNQALNSNLTTTSRTRRRYSLTAGKSDED